MILVIDVCAERLHSHEFVRPVMDILSDMDTKTVRYDEITQTDLDACTHIIICGTSLQDNDYMEHLDRFSWIKETEKPVLGICAGMQIIGAVFGCGYGNKTEIGYFTETLHDFLGAEGETQVYHLHNNYVNANDEFFVCDENEIPQAIKHKSKPIYGALFHPEVRNKEMIRAFAKV